MHYTIFISNKIIHDFLLKFHITDYDFLKVNKNSDIINKINHDFKI